MRLFLIPISTKRVLVYARPLNKDLAKELSILDRITTKAAETWAKWEEADKGWKMHLVSWGNRVQQRIPYEEWALKSIPSFKTQLRINGDHGKTKVDVLFPGNAVRLERIQQVVRTIATERQELHRKKMMWSLIAAPITAPLGLIPVVPNIPFFYLAYRGWSHWRALNGSRHLEFLVEKNLLNPISLPELERLFAKRASQKLEATTTDTSYSEVAEDIEEGEDRVLLQMSDAKKLATILEAPELVLEAERAIIQVNQQLEAAAKAKQNKKNEKNDS
ncbi:mitochondrial K+-H+ exchange-related-domain-containing protein [Penicillium digitatum]|uniref:Mitochondrial K+-H+ exchange-related-domain-containing protein n=3 Tax=Penicillium digitatum TaxID=36651 RepID=K9FTS0_PEND2|nr:hypothetical protein PDIP_27900 [Penicillium digitatum Pd1]EKV06173.1 hypothetical protein PDIG_79510 [Penicillium digitatum PHI26]EKV18242.1 hypothetical protein PDIP_27900 [Penicillium digitatum Pd1]KAG0154982.1 hypothetical protein PDIDSM_555 [Penicillium digitatum]QQK47113.1 mitochondrial K+-H+ exchange-related-domain-containing protein [Penicillium digitatum]